MTCPRLISPCRRCLVAFSLPVSFSLMPLTILLPSFHLPPSSATFFHLHGLVGFPLLQKPEKPSKAGNSSSSFQRVGQLRSLKFVSSFNGPVQPRPVSSGCDLFFYFGADVDLAVRVICGQKIREEMLATDFNRISESEGQGAY